MLKLIGDLFYALAQWLKTTPLVEFSLWFSKTHLSETIDRNFWFIPIAQIVHILAIAAAFGSVLMISFRVLGLSGMNRTVEQTARRYTPWILWSLATLLASGLVIIIGDPIRVLLNPCFWIKMILVVVATLVSFWFQASARRHEALWESAPQRRIVFRAGAAAVILMWCVIMLLGRWIAYAAV